MKNKITIMVNSETISLYFKQENEMASISLSFFSNSKIIEKKERKNIWYFNRLFVPPNMRGKGVATQLLKCLQEILINKKIFLICEINPYGDLDYSQLEALYVKNNFKKINDESFLIFNPLTVWFLKIKTRKTKI